MTKAVAIIPARSGSKRIPRKNVRIFHGRPIIAYTIEALLESDCFAKVVVSTDCREIAAVASEHGAEIPFIRPEALGKDDTSLESVVEHALAELESADSIIETFCVALATAPFLKAETIREGWRRLKDKRVDGVLSTVSFDYPIWRALRQMPNGGIEMLWSDYMHVRSNDLEECFHDAGQFYWLKRKAFMEHLTLLPPKLGEVRLSREFAQDIDTLDDWQYAESLFSLRTLE
ncbi:pseudaminic acid cytidylyltransferase [Gammaproteobacteria bacterium]|nr:pseudaminic acid cytidylyltransferase [Gammaproteobacteria bacterium]MDC3279522.1 pseudaminic acid cytidylyltransferase [Gammaproteobacteria bacterium]